MIKLHFKNTFRERLPEWISALALIVWGLLVLSEVPELWNKQYFSVLSRIATQNTWGLTAVIIGIIRLIALGINGAWRPTAHFRAIGAVLGATLWSTVLISYTALDWNPPSMALKGAMIVLDIAAIWYAAGDAKLADLKAHNKQEVTKSLQAIKSV